MASENYVLFDLASKAPHTCWSLNPWKTRMLFNFKGVNYETKWVEYPDIKPTLEPHLPGLENYTIPTIALPSGKYITDSRAIAEYIDSQHPSPPINLTSPKLATLQELLPEIMPLLRGLFVPLMPDRVLNQASIPYWIETRTKATNTTSMQDLAEKHGGQQAWDKVEPLLKKVTELLKDPQDKTGEGPFFHGGHVTYADFVWGGLLLMFQRVGEDVFGPLLKSTGDEGAHRALLKGLEPWTERNDH